MRGMDFFRSCGTGVQTLTGWNTFVYHVYSATRKRTEPQSQDDEGENSIEFLNSCLDLEARLRDANFLTWFDIKQQLLWTVDPQTAQGDFTRGPAHDSEKLNEDEELQWQVVCKGLFKASDLAITPRMSQRAKITKANGILVQSDTDDLKKLSSTESYQPAVPAEIYCAFLCALDDTLSYRLASRARLIPLSRSLFTLGPASGGSSDDDGTSGGTAILLQLRSYLTSSGTLVLSASHPTRPLVPLTCLLSPGLGLEGMSLILAPAMVSVAYAGAAVGVFDTEKNCTWRQMLTRWLLNQGIHMEHLDQASRWISVKFGSTRRYQESGSSLAQETLWPVDLCFVDEPVRDPGSADTKADHDHAVSKAEDGYCYQNGAISLDAAEAWLKEGAERDRRIAERRQRQKEKMAPQPIFNIPSPSNARNITYGDTHSASGVYPTPPDAMTSQQAAALGILGTSPLTMTDQTSGVSNVDVVMAETPSVVLDVPPPPDDVDVEDTFPDDLFDDMDLDEDDFGGNDITDADFNFFDKDDDFIGSSKANIAPKAEIQSDVSLGENKGDGQIDVKPEAEDTKVTVPMATYDKPIHDSNGTGPREVLLTDKHHDSIPTLNPASIADRLFGTGLGVSRSGHRGSGTFDSLSFDIALGRSDTKYQNTGVFGSKDSDEIDKKRKSVELLSVNGDVTSPIERKLRILDLPGRRSNQADLHSQRGVDDGDSSSDSESVVMVPAVPSGVDEGVTTKDFATDRATDALLDADLSAMSSLFRSLVSRELSAMPDSNSLATCSPSLSPLDFDNESKELQEFDEDFISIAQLVVQQLAFAPLALPLSDTILSTSCFRSASCAAASSAVALQRSVHNTMKAGEESRLVKYASLIDAISDQQAAQKQQQRPLHPKAPLNNRPDNSISGHPIRLPIPFVNVRRNVTSWHVLPPALAFWDLLGLGPIAGPKNITAWALYPKKWTKGEIVTTRFLQELGQVFEHAKFGTHAAAESKAKSEMSACLSYAEPETANSGDDERSLRQLSSDLGVYIAGLDSPKKLNGSASPESSPTDAFAVYIVIPMVDAESVLAVAGSFQHMLNTYRKSTTTSPFRSKRPEIILQIVPQAFAELFDGPLVPNGRLLHSLARDIYSRSPSPVINESPALPIVSGSDVQLTEPLPRKIAFDLTADPPSDIMYDFSQLHVGYARSKSGNWISAAYSDNTGKHQATVSYCMTGSRNFTDIAKEIWQTCLVVMQARRVNWRLCIARAGRMETEEIEAWANLASPQQPLPLITLLCELDLTPPISLVPTSVTPSAPQTNATTKPGVGTPIGTPATQQGISPDPGALTPVGTPSENAAADLTSDPDAHLVDLTDETWSIILSHRLNLRPTSPSSLDFRRTLSSGLLMKLPPATPTPNPFNAGSEMSDPSTVPCIAVHLLWARNSAKTADAVIHGSMGNPSAVPKVASDNILREYLGLFRNLALLAKVRGMGDGRCGLVPWHVLVAVRAVEVLDGVYGGKRWVNTRE